MSFGVDLFFDRILHGRIENLFLDLGVDDQLHADLIGDALFGLAAFGVSQILEQIFDRAVIAFNSWIASIGRERPLPLARALVVFFALLRAFAFFAIAFSSSRDLSRIACR